MVSPVSGLEVTASETAAEEVLLANAHCTRPCEEKRAQAANMLDDALEHQSIWTDEQILRQGCQVNFAEVPYLAFWHTRIIRPRIGRLYFSTRHLLVMVSLIVSVMSAWWVHNSDIRHMQRFGC